MTLEMTEAIKCTEELIKIHQDKYNSLPKKAVGLRCMEVERIGVLVELKGRLALKQVE